MLHKSKYHQYRHLVRRAYRNANRRQSPGYGHWYRRYTELVLAHDRLFGPRRRCPEARKVFGLVRATEALTLRSRATWKTQTFKGVPSKVAFTHADLKKMTPVRDERGRIIGLDGGCLQPKTKRRTIKQYRDTLANLLAWLDGEHDNSEILERARELAA